MANLFKILLILFIVLKGLFILTLNILNVFYLKNNAGKVPELLQSTINEEKLLKIDSYNATKVFYRIILFLFDNLILLVFLFTPLFPKYCTWIESLPIHYYFQSLCFFLILTLITWILELPFSWHNQFVIEARFGFNQYTLLYWFKDQIKGLISNIVLLGLTLTVFFSIWGIQPIFSWGKVMLGCLITFIFTLLLMYLFPMVALPFFYRLKPVENEELLSKIKSLVEHSGFKVRKIVTAEESTKSTHVNAQFSGLGKSKTIILFDTLLKSYSDTEILAVLAHEIGHGKKRHLLKLMVLTVLELFLFILFASYLLTSDFTFKALGIHKVVYSGLFVIYILFENLLFFVQPIFSTLSRKLEYEADAFSKKLLASGEPLRSVFKKFISDELQPLNTHPWYEAFFYSHPSLLKRIRALE